MRLHAERVFDVPFPPGRSPVRANAKMVEHGVNGFWAGSSQDRDRAIAIWVACGTLRHFMHPARCPMVTETYSLQAQGPRLTGLLHRAAVGG